MILLFLTVNICHAQWILQNSTTDNTLNDVSFTDSLHGWVAGNNGIILHTSDGGNSWSPQISTIGRTLESISFCDTMNGWAVGDGGTVLTTSNGGETWRFIELDTSINIFNTKVQCLTSSSAVISNKKWEFDIFVDPRLWITFDTGVSWAEIAPQASYYNSWWYDFHFVTDSIGFFAGISGDAYEKLIVAKTIDGGLTLDTSYINWKVQGGFKRIYFMNRYEGWLLGDSIYHSIDAGINWKGSSTNIFNTSKDLVMFGDTGYIVQTDGKIFQTTDGGYNWNAQLLGVHLINKIDFINPKVGWAVGQNGTIVYTNNAGITNIEYYGSTCYSESFQLYQNYPNPFNPSTDISYFIPKESNVKLKVFNSIGQLVKTLLDKHQSAGEYIINFKSDNLPNGIYFYQLISDNIIITKKSLLLK